MWEFRVCECTIKSILSVSASASFYNSWYERGCRIWQCAINFEMKPPGQTTNSIKLGIN